MGFFSKLIGNKEEKQKDKHIEQAKQLMADKRYDEAEKILREGRDKQESYTFDMWSNYRRAEVKELYNKCCTEIRRESRKTHRSSTLSNQSSQEQSTTKKKFTNEDMDNVIWSIEYELSCKRWQNAMRMIDWADEKFDHSYRFDELEILCMKCQQMIFEDVAENGKNEIVYSKMYLRLQKEQKEKNSKQQELHFENDCDNEAYERYLSRQDQLAAAAKKETSSRFARELETLRIATIGHRNPECPSLGIVMAYTMHHRIGVGEEPELCNEEYITKETCENQSWESISIEVKTENRKYKHIEFMNPSDLVKGLLYQDIDGAVLSIDAVDGITKEVSEQIHLAKIAGIPYVIVFVDGCDLIDEDQQEVLTDEIYELLNDCGYPGEDNPIVYGSLKGAVDDLQSQWSDSVLELLDMMEVYFLEPEKDLDKPFLMPVEDVFVITDRGIVATGKVETGILKLNSNVEIVGFGTDKKMAFVTGIEKFRILLEQAVAEDHVGLLLRGIERADVKKGHVIAKVGTCNSFTTFKAVVHPVAEKNLESLSENKNLKIRMRTAWIPGAISVSKKNICCGGQYAQAIVTLQDSIAMKPGQFIEVKDESKNIIAVGKIVEVM